MKQSAVQFVKRWSGCGDEKSDTQSFWTSLLRDVYGIEHPEFFIKYEQRVKLKKMSFIDAKIPKTKVLIEQKSADVDLTKPIRHQTKTPMGLSGRDVRRTTGTSSLRI